MSAIAGIFRLDTEAIVPAALDRMLSSLQHRGPDGSGSWCAGAVALGHRTFHTTPESARERLPLTHRSAFVVTADARIDNRADLISELHLADGTQGEIGDGELILAAYEKWGERCAEKLVGDFVFAIWDPHQHELFCARDAMGVKPFYYCRTDRVFAFASEIKGVLSLPEVPRRLNDVRVADHLAGIFEDTTSTFYRDIFRLPPAHCLRIGRDGMRTRQYWTPDPIREVRFESDQEYAAAFRALFTEAVRARVRSNCPVGTTLSGGLDSSSIACTARGVMATEHQNGRLATFSAIFSGLPATDLRRIDERQYIDAVVASGGFEPHYVRADRLSPLGDLSTVLRHLDEAFVAPNLYMHWALYRAARQHGARVLLDGIDGDATVSHGIGYLAELAGTYRWNTLAREAAALSARSGTRYTTRRIIWDYGVKPNVPKGAKTIWRVMRGGGEPPWASETILAPDFARRVGLDQRIQALRTHLTPARTAREAHARGLRSPLIPYVLELADKTAAAAGIEPRYPFFDRRLIEFCLSLPPEQKLHGGWTRIVMRRAMAGILPREVQWRYDKANLSPNFTRRLLECERETLDRNVLHDARAIEAYVDVTSLRRMYHRYTAAPTHNAQDAHTIYRVVVLSQWLREAGLPS